MTPEEREIYLTAVNTESIYRSRITPIIKNYQRKLGKGKYNPELAIKGFVYAVEDAIKEYAKTGSKLRLTKEQKHRVAKELLDHYADEINLKEAHQIDELSKKTLASYVKGAHRSQGTHEWESGNKAAKGEYHQNKKYIKREIGIGRALNRLQKEAHQIDEADWGGGFETSREAQAGVQAGLKADAKKRKAMILSAMQKVIDGQMSKIAFKKLTGVSFSEMMTLPAYTKKLKTKK